jgi:hypothetical protein
VEILNKKIQKEQLDHLILCELVLLWPEKSKYIETNQKIEKNH